MPRNAIGREIPKEVDGRVLKPFKGAYVDLKPGHFAPMVMRPAKWGTSKLLPSIDDAFAKTGLKDGACLSFHHHLRNGDGVLNMVMAVAERRGLKGLKLAQSAIFPVHEPVCRLIENGTITSIEGSTNGPVGRIITEGKMKGTAIMRSHGARSRAIQMGDVKIDGAFVAAPVADAYGNANGRSGPAACGPLGYALADSMFAENVVVVTDNLQPYMVTPPIISQACVDYVVKVDSIGDPKAISSGTTEVATDEQSLKIARGAADLVDALGLVRDGIGFQAGAGGASLAAIGLLGELMKKRGVKARFAHGGITKDMIRMQKEGLIDWIIDTQSFDMESAQSLLTNPKHAEINPDIYANPFNRGQLVNMLDFGFLGATEIDIDFNVNVNTHSDGYLLHGIGGHQDVAAGAKHCIIVCPTRRKNWPIVMERVTNVTTPGECIDAIVTEEGIAINPARDDMLEKARAANLPVKDIQELAKIALQKAGGVKPGEPEYFDRVVGVIEWRDGTVIDVVRQLKRKGG
ncbi:MAG: citrate lyase subunit alpha [Euryarchaeota archaeon]|nr:citrate lyase subunit alpha [Euryarchaeota archaeon]